jgi:hypothetical protein
MLRSQFFANFDNFSGKTRYLKKIRQIFGPSIYTVIALTTMVKLPETVGSDFKLQNGSRRRKMTRDKFHET